MQVHPWTISTKVLLLQFSSGLKWVSGLTIGYRLIIGQYGSQLHVVPTWAGRGGLIAVPMHCDPHTHGQSLPKCFYYSSLVALSEFLD